MARRGGAGDGRHGRDPRRLHRRHRTGSGPPRCRRRARSRLRRRRITRDALGGAQGHGTELLMIETMNLRKEFGAKVAVDGLNLSIPGGRVAGLLGLNGAGKTTTFKILATLLRQTSGTVSVGGLDPVRQPHAVRKRINLIAGGERMVYARMTGRENLWYFGQLYDLPTKVLKPRIEELLALVGLTDAATTRVEQYSRGMTQRLSIARGLINDPDYLLLDEPTRGLDAPIARDLRKVVAGLAERGKGVLLTSHYLA